MRRFIPPSFVAILVASATGATAQSEQPQLRGLMVLGDAPAMADTMAKPLPLPVEPVPMGGDNDFDFRTALDRKLVDAPHVQIFAAEQDNRMPLPEEPKPE